MTIELYSFSLFLIKILLVLRPFRYFAMKKWYCPLYSEYGLESLRTDLILQHKICIFRQLNVQMLSILLPFIKVNGIFN